MINQICGVLYFLFTSKIIHLFAIGTIKPTLDSSKAEEHKQEFIVNVCELFFIIVALLLLKGKNI
tara:strand:- start:8254 stop:8448 length:195 start_codon:yes stop_codon:yes gene_type:complete